ncbi:cell division protein FtsZ [Acidovorax sp. SRB_14]|uniref:cell division protein ZipA C-terminal FtsZ-binding domain-containing protein n=1 Tax=unclassified Acidovorax TaxID=2684926 RepID=UPI00145F88B1|nr:MULTISPECIES: cell division protein ZipA C-terminal FtsZ-binding domain-containing protein [unclassified Acidovorax]NMM78649.1 cell division protein FtsZ [Acidovorax sp. SRB_24]NMM78660.1 cell division protein FtsZ [Acidovorax sp. SRB_24]NMM79503.1 cell division protein FtsZ [Acidovorax sp. SRB_14]NMM84755.1 cell division protein FtsZ [Rhodococcus sp. SRB_17]
MSTLQISLAVIGALLLALIVAYNAWTARRNTPKKALPPEGERAAEPALRQEPGFDIPASPETEAHALAPGAEPAPHSVDLHDALDLPVPPPPERRPGLDALIDAIAPLQADHPVSGDAAMAALPPTRRAGSKPFAIEGYNERTQHWETPVAGQRYHAFQAGVQLANRTGALNEIEFSEFVVKAQAFADAVNAAPDFPDMRHEVARARELDQFASEHDAQLAFVLRARQAAWSPGYLQQNAARLGFVPGAMPGRMVLPAGTPGLPPVLSLVFDAQAALSEDMEQSAVRDLLISLDVSQVNRAEQPFARLREAAAALCEAMDGVLCDQNGTPLPAMAMEPIAADLELLYDKLDSRDLSAGSVLARRLFS